MTGLIVIAACLIPLMINAHWQAIARKLDMSIAKNTVMFGHVIYWQAIHHEETLSLWIELNHERSFEIRM